MVVIEKDSTFALVVQANEVMVTDDDLAAWGLVELPIFVEDDELNNRMWAGVFGFDLTDFWRDCLIATDNCPYDELYANYDGWAVGAFAEMSYNVGLTGIK